MAMKRKNLPELVPQVFEHKQFGKIRVVTIEGEPFPVGIDVATALGYANLQKALRDHVPEKFKRTERIVHPLGGAQDTILINEAGMYRLVLRSRLPKAEEFTDWTCEVLVRIRKYGYYSVEAEKKLIVYLGKPALELSGEKADLRRVFRCYG